MSETPSNRIAKNTFYLYARSFLIMLITLYSSRVVLSVLSIEGYGVYNLVGGVVGLFASLRGVFATSIQRYINYARGEKKEDVVQYIFVLGFWIHLGLAVLFFILVGSFGIWFIPNKLVLPDGMLEQAIFVFVFSLFSAVVSIIGVPYDALIIANERMNFYAYVAILDAVLRLAILFVLPIFPYNGLKIYAVLLFLIALMLTIAKIIYCFRFAESKIIKYWNNKLFKDLATFSGWNFFGNVVFTLINEGSNLILNMFAGVIVNAARGIAYQVKSALITLSNNVITASEPFIMQQAAFVGKQKLFSYVFLVSRVIFFVMIITAVPIFVFTKQILSLWLNDVPEYTEIFVKIIMIHVIIRSLHSPINTLFSSLGKLKKYQIAEFLVGIIELPVMYILLYIGLPIYTPFIIMIIWELLNLFVILKVANLEAGLRFADYYKNVIIRCTNAFIVVSIVTVPFLYITREINGIWTLGYIAIFVVWLSIVLYFIVLDNEEKKIVNSLIDKVIKSRK